MGRLLIAAVFAMAAASAHAVSPDDVERVGVHELKTRLDGGQHIVIIDARSKGEYSRSLVRIKGATRIPYERLDERMDRLPHGSDIVFYCSEFDDNLAVRSAMLLLTNGFANVKVLKGGFDAWKFYDYPMEFK